MSELLFSLLPIVCVAINAISAGLAKDDIKAIKYLLWAILFSLVPITDALVNGGV